ncbi:SEL1-like repeat protein [Butyrivibrio sp. VCD2006]|uniref:SEL1-like repeat protein n=1 Tax=Butyrivibrio sp. VCD2006 TaxID=1280664 RepID=UPI00047D7EB2|nr:SEL1-like repeat protein [Butyrivibrio sp. VCD2006]
MAEDLKSVGGSPRKVFLLYKLALRNCYFDPPEIDEEFNEAEVYYKVGKCYFEGYGVRKDYYKAIWYLDYARDCFRPDYSMVEECVKMIREAYARAEELVSDDEEGEYYKCCFEEGNPFLDYFPEEDEEDDYLS